MKHDATYHLVELDRTRFAVSMAGKRVKMLRSDKRGNRTLRNLCQMRMIMSKAQRVMKVRGHRLNHTTFPTYQRTCKFGSGHEKKRVEISVY